MTIIGSGLDKLLIIVIVFAAVVFGLKATTSLLKYRSRVVKISRRVRPGIQFGKKRGAYHYSPQSAEGHVCVMAGSGLGKTTTQLIPTLRSWTGPSLCIDISGDILANVNMPNELVYEPENSETIKYDILYPIDILDSPELKNQALNKLAYLLLPELPPGKGTGNADFFNKEGRNILAASMIAFYHEGLDFIEICDMIAGNNYRSLFSAIKKTGNELASRMIKDYEGGNEQTNTGCKQAAGEAIDLFVTNEIVRKSIGRPKEGEDSFTANAVETHNVFVLIDDSRLELYSPLVHIIVAQVLECLSQRDNLSGETILIALDEFASFGKLEITPATRKLRKKNVRIMILTQSLADIDMIYGRDERMALMNNFAFKAVLGAGDTESQDYISKLIGNKEIKKKSISRRDEPFSQFNIIQPMGKATETVERELAVQPEELSRLGKYMILLFPGGWEKLRKKPFYKRF